MSRNHQTTDLEIHQFPRPLIIGHRGYRARFPENTLSAFKAAIDAGADMIELDVQLSSDGWPVVIHDRTLERTTDGVGPVTAHPLSELKRLDAGAWFHPRFGGESIPTLDEALELIGGRVLANIEIKVDPGQPPREYKGIEKKVVDAVDRRRLAPRTLVSSFHRQILKNLREIAPGAAIGVLTEFGEDLDLHGVCRALNAFSWNPCYLELSAVRVAGMHQKGLRVIPYTVNAPDDIRGLIEMGVDGLFTDDPALALGIRDAGQ